MLETVVVDSEVVARTLCVQLQLDAYQPVVRYGYELLNNEDQNRPSYRTGLSCDKSGTDCWTLSVTGHSLGGGMASIVGTSLAIPVIG